MTRDVDPDSVRDLLERVPRACISFAGDDGPRAEPVAFIFSEGRYLVGLPPGSSRAPRPGQEVALLVDEGVQWFDLRGICIRGPVERSEPPPNTQGERSWLEVAAERIVAWDYGMLREAAGEG